MNGSVFSKVITELASSDEQSVLAELVAAAAAPEGALDAVVARERKGSTAIGNGVAVPHARIEGLQRLTAVLGRSTDGIRFGNSIVHIFVLVLVPEEAAAAHLDFLSAVVRRLSSETDRRMLLEAGSESEMLEVLFP